MVRIGKSGTGNEVTPHQIEFYFIRLMANWAPLQAVEALEVGINKIIFFLNILLL